MTIPAYGAGISAGVTNASVISFITTDPLGLGLAAIRTANPGADAPLETVLNTVSDIYQVPASPMTAANFEELFDATEFATFTAAMESQIQLMFSAGTINVGNSQIQADLNALFASYPKTLANVKAAYTQNGSPWGYYFGVGLSASNAILDAARNSGSGSNF